MGKVEKTRFERNWTTFVNLRVFFRFAPMGKVEKTRFELFALLGKAHSKWWYETDLVEFDPKGVFSFRPDGESRKNAF